MGDPFQPRAGVDYPRTFQEFDEWFATEAGCRDYVVRLRWPTGFRCPHCDAAGLSPQHGPQCKAVTTACTVCRLFGNPAIPALLRVGQARPIPPWDTLLQQLLGTRHNPVLRPDVEIRPGIALSRSRRTALPDHLFFDETVPAITFCGKMLLEASINPQERCFLIGAGKLVDALGARKSTGRGALEGGIQIRKCQL